jgi:aspartate racemase
LTKYPHGRCLGLIGGLGVGAAVHYYRELAKAHEARGCEMRLLMAHAHIQRAAGLVRAGDTPGLAQYLAELLRRLHAGGAEIAAIPAVTPHICAGELAAMSPLPLVNVLEVASREIRAGGLRRVALFGTRFTIETGLFGHLRDVELVNPKPDELAFIHDTYMQMALEGAGSEKQRQSLTALAHTLLERDGAEAIVLAGTDLALVFNEANTDFPHIDCARAHVDAIMRALFDGPQTN